MLILKTKRDRIKRRHLRTRKKIHGTASRPRLAVFTSSSHIYAQIIDDDAAKTLVSVSTAGKNNPLQAKPNVEGAKKLGKAIAEKAAAAGISSVVFDKGGFKYHGKIKAFADAAREAGLKF